MRSNKNKNLINNIDPETNFIIIKMDSDLKNIFSNNNHVDIVDVIVKTIGDPTDPTPKFIRLNLSDNLLSIRKNLKRIVSLMIHYHFQKSLTMNLLK